MPLWFRVGHHVELADFQQMVRENEPRPQDGPLLYPLDTDAGPAFSITAGITASSTDVAQNLPLRRHCKAPWAE